MSPKLASKTPRLAPEAPKLARNARRADADPGAPATARLWKGVNKTRIGMLTTVSDRGLVRSRPMTVQEVEPDGTLWFFVASDTDAAGEIGNDSRVNASFANPDENFFLSVAGRAFVIQDREKVEALWTPFAAAWFPEGPTDPTLRLLRVDPQRVDYWTSGGGKLMRFLALARSTLTGTAAKLPASTHQTFEPT